MTTLLCRMHQSDEECSYLKETKELVDRLNKVEPRHVESYFFVLIPEDGPDSPRALVGPFLNASDCASHEKKARNLLFPTVAGRNQETFQENLVDLGLK